VVTGPAGGRAAGADVGLAELGGEGPPLTTRTGADGRFAFPERPPGDGSLGVLAGKDGLALGYVLTGPRGGTVAVALRAPVSVGGTIRDPAGRPGAGAGVAPALDGATPARRQVDVLPPPPP